MIRSSDTAACKPGITSDREVLLLRLQPIFSLTRIISYSNLLRIFYEYFDSKLVMRVLKLMQWPLQKLCLRAPFWLIEDLQGGQHAFFQQILTLENPSYVEE